VPGSRDRPVQPYAAGQPDAPQRLSADPQPRPADRADRLAAADQPPRWSRAELQQRLERLPPGHPSSPRIDRADGESPRRVAESYRESEADWDDKADADKPHYWSEVDRFLKAAEDHKRRWPAERATTPVDRSHDPAGSWRGDGGQYLDVEQHAQAKDVIAMAKAKEEKITDQLGEADRDPSCLGRLVGLEHRLKGDDRLKQKIADLLETAAPDATTEEILRAIPDAIRYTFCANAKDYAEVYWDVKERLQARGFEIDYSQNHWTDTQYKGINTRWLTPEGQRFEVQFHTAESFDAKENMTHWAYERLRNPLTQDEERQELMAFQQEVFSWVPLPARAAEIPDYRKEGH
jgi:hypothetical protein